MSPLRLMLKTQPAWNAAANLPQQGLVSYLDTRSATAFVDSVGTSDRPVQPGRGYKYDGTDDYIKLPSLDLTHTNRVTVFVKAIYTQFTTTQQVFEISNPFYTNTGAFAAFIDATNAKPGFVGINGNAGLNITFYDILAYEDVLTDYCYVFDMSVDGANEPEGKLYINGSASTTYSHDYKSNNTGNFRQDDLYIGMRGGSSYPFKGKIFEFVLFDYRLTDQEIADLSNGVMPVVPPLVHYKCDEAAGTTAYDSSGNGNHGTMYNITPSTFHATDNRVRSWQNEVGYSEGTGGVLVPRDESNPTLDVLGNTLQYSGRVKYNASLVQSACGTADGVDDYIQCPHSLSGVTITSYEGTATPTIDSANNRINLTAGTIYNIVLSDGTHYPVAEGAGTTLYDVSGNGNHATLVNISTSIWWAGTQDTYHYNIDKGFSLYQHATDPDLRVPYDTNGQPLSITPPSGYTLASEHPAGNWHNGAETKIQMPAADANFTAGTFWMDSSGNLQARSYNDIVGIWNDPENVTFADVSVTNKKKRIATYDSAQSGSALTQIKQYLNIP